MSKSKDSKSQGVTFTNADDGKVDKKFEGYSNLKGQYDTQQKKIHKG